MINRIARYRRFYFLGPIVIVTFCFLLFDFLYGQVSGISEIRDQARQFRSEAAPLKIGSRSLVPNLQHVYRDAYRPEGEIYVPRAEPRRFYTDNMGTVTAHQRPSSETQVLFLGGSTTECNEVDEAFRFPALVGRKLSELGVEIRATNAGVRGHTTHDAINLYLNRPNLLVADIVVLMENINDRLLLALNQTYGADLSSSSPTSFDSVYDAISATMRSIWTYAAYRVNLLFYLQQSDWFGRANNLLSERSLDRLPMPGMEAQAQYERNLRIFVGVVRSINKVPVLMTQPLGRPSPSHAIFNDIIRKVSLETGVLLIDLDELLPTDRGWAYLGDHIHLSNRGSQEVAQQITAKLAPLFNRSYSPRSPDTGVTSLSSVVGSCLAPQDLPINAPIQRVYRVVGTSGRYPTLSEDGSWLLFQSRLDDYDSIYALRLSDQRLFSLTAARTRWNERHPSFLHATPNEFSIIFGSGTVGNGAGKENLIIRTWPDNRSQAVTLPQSLSASIPMPSRGRLLFAAADLQEDAPAPNIYSYDLPTGRLIRLTHNSFEHWRPVASSDGNVFFISNETGRFSIYRFEEASGTTRRIISSSFDEWDPAVSPDGRWLAFASKRNGNWDIFVAPTSDLSKIRQITDLPGDEWDPAWHPNGRVLLFGSAQNAPPTIMATCAFGEQK